MNRIDLHLHTTYSDGSFPPIEVLTFAQTAGVTALAITDHDILDGISEAMEAGSLLGIEIIPGVEISSCYGASELHILGYFFNWKDEILNQRMRSLRDSRHARNPQIIRKLNEAGIEITYDDVTQLAGAASVGRPHIARVLMNKGIVSSAKEAFDRYLAEGRTAYVPRELPEPETVIRWIREAGGVPVLAHPVWVKQSGEALEVLLGHFKESGLGGIEVHYSTHTPRQTNDYLSLAKRLDLLVTGGSDFHGITKPDIFVGTGRGDLKVPEKVLDPLRKAASVG